MLSRTGLVRDILIVTVCGALWMAVLMGADGDWEDAQPASTPIALPAESKSDSDATEVAKAAPADELPLFLDSKTKPTQTKPDDPTRELASGVTVASRSAPKPRTSAAAPAEKPLKVELLQVAPDRASVPQVERSPDSLSSRQASLSYGDGTEVALVDQRTALKRQDAPAQKPITQPRQFLPRSEPGNRAVPPAPVKQLAAQPQPVKQQPVPSAQPAGAEKIRIETQQLADTGVKPVPAKPVVQPAAKPQSAASKPLTASNKPASPAVETARLAPSSKPAVQGAKPAPPAARPATLTAQARPKAQLNGGMRVMTPRREAPAVSQAAPVTLQRSEATAVEDRQPTLPEGEELLTPEMLAAEAAAPLSEAAVESIASAPVPPVPSLNQSRPQSEPRLASDLPADVVITSVTPAPAWTPTAIVMALLAVALFVLWLWLRRRPTPPTPLTLLQQKAVSVIETISLAPNRQIVLVEVSGNALVLGVTPQSINLLERLPLALLAQNYQPTVESIIVRESAQAAQWAEAPRMAAAGGGGPVMPFSQPRVPGVATRTSLAELRRQQAARSSSLSIVGTEAERD